LPRKGRAANELKGREVEPNGADAQVRAQPRHRQQRLRF
jgi:hypothetical protein